MAINRAADLGDEEKYEFVKLIIHSIHSHLLKDRLDLRHISIPIVLGALCLIDRDLVELALDQDILERVKEEEIRNLDVQCEIVQEFMKEEEKLIERMMFLGLDYLKGEKSG